MKRILKNVIMILIIIAVGIGSYFTMKDVNNGAQPSKMENQEMSQDGQNEPPAKPEENSQNTSSEKSNQTMPQMNEGENQQTPPQMPSSEKQIEGIYYVLFAIEGIVISTFIIYLIMSKFNKLTFSQTLEKTNKKVIFIIMIIIVTVILTVAQAIITKNVFLSNGPENNM